MVRTLRKASMERHPYNPSPNTKADHRLLLALTCFRDRLQPRAGCAGSLFGRWLLPCCFISFNKPFAKCNRPFWRPVQQCIVSHCSSRFYQGRRRTPEKYRRKCNTWYGNIRPKFLLSVDTRVSLNLLRRTES